MRRDVRIVHDHLVQRGGAERVVASMSRALDAPIRTSVFEPGATHPEVRTAVVCPSILNRCAPLRRNHRWAFPLMAPLFASFRPDAQTTILSTAGWSHFARPRGRSIAYWYAPARWLYQQDVYLGRGWKGGVIRGLAPTLEFFDRRAVARIDHHVAVSTAVADRLRSIYGIDAEVLHPPLTFRGTPEPIPGIEPGFHLVVSRFMRYKNVDLLLETFEAHPDWRLVVVGSGPDERRLRAMAPGNVHFAGPVSDDQLAWLYEQCSFLITTAVEDFGLTPLEAALHGRPSVALHAGGFIDTILPGVTGVFIDELTVAAVEQALKEAGEVDWSRERLVDHAHSFSESAFVERLTQLVDGDRVPSP